MSIGAAVGILAGGLVNPTGAGSRPVTNDDLAGVWSDIQYRFTVIADVLKDADNQVANAGQAATEAATQAEVIGQNVKDITNRTYTVVIPHSMSWLAGYMVSHFITPLQVRMDTAESNIRFLLGWRGQIDNWRKTFVDPNVELWVGFRQFFDSWPQSILFMWKDWLENPDHFAQWAAAPLIGPLVSYLAATEHKQTRDNLTGIIGRAWAEESGKVYDDVLTFLLSDT